MQVVLGSAAANAPLDEFLRHNPVDEVEIVDANGTALAYLIPAPRAGDETYAKFETIFQNHAEVLRRRAAKPSGGVSTDELLTKLRVLNCQAGEPCDLP